MNMTQQNQHDGIDHDDETWDLISREEAPEENIDPPSSTNQYMQFQLNSRFGRLSFTMRSMTTTTHTSNNNSSSIEAAKLPINPQPHSPLFRLLPAEIRLHIYELVLHVPPPRGKTSITLTNRATHPWIHSVLAILLTCRLVHSEAETIFYSINRISYSPSSHSPGCYCISLRRREAMTNFEIPPGSVTSIYTDLEMLTRQAPNLKSLYLRRSQSIKFTDAKSWGIMARQIQTELQAMKPLEEVKIFTPEAKGELSEADLERQKKLEKVDEGVCEVVRKKKATTKERTSET